MTTLNKALTRPAAIMGIPLVPFVLVSGAIVLLSVYVSHYLALLLIPAWLEMRAKARADIHYFGLWWLAFKTRGRFATNRHFGATAMLANQYDAVDISEFTDKMKLNARITLDKYIPYSSHLHPHVIRNRHGDFVATWELGGTLFECEDEHHLTLMTSHLNNLIRSYEGLPVTFYIHRIRETYQDAFEATSGIPFSDEVATRYYRALNAKPLWRHRLFFTVCYAPFSTLEKKAMKTQPAGKRQAALDQALKVMLEHHAALGSALSRYMATPLGTYEEKGRVYSSQLAFYHRLITGQWQPVAVTRSPFYLTLSTPDVFFTTDTAECQTVGGSRFFRSLEIKDYSPETATGLLDALLYAESEYVLTQSFTCMARDEAQHHIRLAEKRLNATDDDALMQDYPPELRRYGITRLLEVLPEPPTREARTNGLRIRLKQWAQGGEFGWIFDNAEDSFNIGESDNIGIDGTEFLDDDDTRGPITFYLLFRVTSLLDGRRLVMFMDEFWKWLADVEFSKFSLNMLKVIRKLNGIFIPATQSPDEIVRHPIAPAIIEQCSTQIFLANPKASRADYVEKMNVPDSVYDTVRRLDPGEHYMVIVKTPLRAGETRPFVALARMDLSGLGNLTTLLSGSEDNLKRFDALYQEGMSPHDWKATFLEQAI
ncbi:VirB3 family type IV secretion system protein [Dickeya dianthicola]|uniref:VirB4 family type IV secretion/conjugal transfer ATPase n=1 Tax=Dickeya dianthicola TaxID=204039 RepID=UPI000399B783|nr:VirB3 family type IV secretion system protein [Dickeya dianthicola]MCI4032929.1 VirB3 family type IV secretion system protein [Dickeya dianthicola]MCI4173146.1 VirB3 family type IV secretion system protein [Dickeya dianthicola]MCI4177233.1 VirB3 family type IV secretion system protein [Dickeya dianthicola]MCI4183361.1 VirB3 family type IV secretion system protein [Dickeya dianthicola]MCI4196997.1 VirB3 family type IV secretion system protein [Dickeya dianthicola]